MENLDYLDELQDPSDFFYDREEIEKIENEINYQLKQTYDNA